MERLEKMRKDYIQGFTTMMGESHANLGHQRFTQATKLYFRVMESLLKLVNLVSLIALDERFPKNQTENPYF